MSICILDKCKYEKFDIHNILFDYNAYDVAFEVSCTYEATSVLSDQLSLVHQT